MPGAVKHRGQVRQGRHPSRPAAGGPSPSWPSEQSTTSHAAADGLRRAAGSVRPCPPRSARGQVRLAELVAALSLGIDLGFGQPMEHVLRQCLIALRLGELLGLDEEDAVGRLLHRAARQRGLPHRRPRAGEVVRRRHRPEGDEVRVRAVQRPRRAAACCACSGRAARRCTASAIGLEFAISGRQEVDDMIARTRALARPLAERARSRRRRCSTRSAASYERWDGAGWPGELAGDDDPDRVPDRPARRVRRGRPPHRWRRRGARAGSPSAPGKQFDPDARRLLCAPTPTRSSTASTTSATWDDGDRRRAVARRRALRRPSVDDALAAIADFVDLKSPYTLGHSRGRRRARRRRRRGSSGSAPTRSRRCAGPGSCTTSAGSACRTRSGTSGAARGRRVGAGTAAPATSPSGCCSSRRALAPLGAHRRPAPRAARRLGLPARAVAAAAISRPARILAPPTRTRRCASPVPTADALGRRRGGRAAGRGPGRAARRRRGRGGARRRRSPVRRRREGPAGLTAREVEVLALLARGPVEQGDRRAARDLAEDRGQPHRAHLHEDRRLEPGRGQPVRRAARPAARARSDAVPAGDRPRLQRTTREDEENTS